MSDTVQLQVRSFGRPVIEHQYGALASDKELLQSENLPPISKRTLGEQAQLRQRIKNHAARSVALNGLEHLTGGLAELDFRRRQHGQLLIASKLTFIGNQFDNFDAV